jgi:hypothetical protein
MGSGLIEPYVEAICEKGCQSVREDIRLLRQGVILPELKDLDTVARQKVLKELQSIMAVYGEGCPAVPQKAQEKDELAYERKKKNSPR